ncbi:MAG TPA: hypothetical protein VEL76_15985 [Gemmataceae bacterium]|nr:hypothetical protein [Gemmataceae bacterium]
MSRQVLVEVGVALVLSNVISAPHAVRAQDNPAKAEAERRAIAAIEEMKGSVIRDPKKPGQPVTHVTFYDPIDAEAIELLKAFPALTSLGFARIAITDAILARVAELTQLESLDLGGDKVTDAGLGHLKGLTRLESLLVGGAAITDTGLAHLKGFTRLRWLTLDDVPITDSGLVHLQGLTRLRWLHLTKTNVTDAGVARLKESLPYTLINVGWRRGKESQRAANPSNPLLAKGALVALGTSAALVLLLRPWRRGAGWRRWVWKIPLILAPILLLADELQKLAPAKIPITEGDPVRFWLCACKVDVGLESVCMGGFYQPRDGWYIYYDQGFHGQFLYRVKEADVQALFPRVVQKLQGAPAGVLAPDVEAAYREWVRVDPGRTDAKVLLRKVREAQLTRLWQENPEFYEHVATEEEAFSERWVRVNRYDWNLRFEFCFLAGLLVFAAWPWLRGGGFCRWAVHLGLVPILFCLPFWLGYAQMTFTSAPSGGVLYPQLLRQFPSVPRTGLDRPILRSLPQVLEPLSQTPGPMMSLSGGGGPAPVGVTLLGIGIAGLIVAAGIAQRRLAQPGPPT